MATHRYTLEEPTMVYKIDDREIKSRIFKFRISEEANHPTSLKNPDALKSRRDVIDFILKVMRYCNLDPKLTYLAINYVDRYLHKRGFAKGQNTDVIATVCLSIAAETLGVNAFSYANLKLVDGFKRFDSQALRNADFDVKETLRWYLQSVTPFGFLGFFVGEMTSIQNLDLVPLEERASEILIEVQLQNVGFLEYRPSVIAAAAVLCAAEEIYPQTLPAYMNDVLNSPSIEEAMVRKLYPQMKAVLRADKKLLAEGSKKQDDGSSKKKRRIEEI